MRSFPVIVLDQFEENLISHRGKSELLLKQIYALVDDNKDFPQAIIQRRTSGSSFQFGRTNCSGWKNLLTSVSCSISRRIVTGSLTCRGKALKRQ